MLTEMSFAFSCLTPSTLCPTSPVQFVTWHVSEPNAGTPVLGEPSPTPYDLKFRIFDFPVRVSPWFWVVSIFLGQGVASRGAMTLILWMLAVFVSILIHELGHSLAFRHFGIPSQIVLYQFGGLAIPNSFGSSWGSRSFDPRSQAMISAAGPFAQLMTGVLVLGAIGLSGHGFGFVDTDGSHNRLLLGFFEKILPIPSGELFASNGVNLFLSFFVVVSLFWALLNLIPVYPLDGGQITRNVLMAGGANQPIETSLMVSICAGAAAALYGVMRGELYLAILFGMLAYSSYQSLNRSGGGLDRFWRRR
jgi:stage IV sporulation protein FB